MLPNPSQTPPFNGYMPMVNANVSSGGASEITEFSTHINLDGTTFANQVTSNSDDSTPKSKKKKEQPWNTEHNLVLISGWIKFSTDSIVGRNQKGETYWGKIAENCNEHCSFDPPRDAIACRNRYNYMNKILNKWIGAYDSAKRLQASGWSENDILAKAQELYACGKNIQFTLMEEWHALRDQPRYSSQVGGTIGSGSSGSKRSHDDACGSNSVESSTRPIGREAAKKKGKKKSAMEVVDQDWDNYRIMKEKEMEQLARIVSNQQEKNKLKKMSLYLKLSSNENLDDRKKAMLDSLAQELFPN
ncbi:hypothetical protein L195_g027073 [Trifolium pratense]|uniref:Myb-like domain-containing protein n=1 Tax=Trifolium pratense TaxID=57577 RepID=A0A2K3KY40_TRIPR|nr:hypothetical protein L195_g027073 [Trifolium pratense]